MEYFLTPGQYSKQTMFVEGIIEHHPDFHPRKGTLFTLEAVAIFERVFLPNWDALGSYVEVFHSLFDTDPGLLQVSQRLLKKFCDSHGVETEGLLHPVPDLDPKLDTWQKPTPEEIQAQMEFIHDFAARALATSEPEVMKKLLEEILEFHGNLAPEEHEDDIDRDVDSAGIDLMLGCEHWLIGHIEYAHEFFTSHLPKA